MGGCLRELCRNRNGHHQHYSQYLEITRKALYEMNTVAADPEQLKSVRQGRHSGGVGEWVEWVGV